MSSNEITLLSILGVFGILVGSVGGIVAAHRRKKLIVAVVQSALVAALVPLMFWFVWTTFDAMSVHGYSFGRAMGVGIVTLFLLAFSVPFVTGLPSMISSIISYFIARRCCAKRIAEQGAPSNGGQRSSLNSGFHPAVEQLQPKSQE